MTCASSYLPISSSPLFTHTATECKLPYIYLNVIKVITDIDMFMRISVSFICTSINVARPFTFTGTATPQFDQRVINPFAIAALGSIVFRYPHKIKEYVKRRNNCESNSIHLLSIYGSSLCIISCASRRNNFASFHPKLHLAVKLRSNIVITIDGSYKR